MIEKQTTLYKCSYCRKWGQVRAAMEKHERHCPSNPNREPKVGELYGDDYHCWFLMAGITEELMPHKPTEHGMIWTGQDWLPVPEYDEGRYGGPQWPSVGETGYDPGTPLDKIPTPHRLTVLDKEFGPAWAIEERSRRIEAAKPKMLPAPSADDVSDPFAVAWRGE